MIENPRFLFLYCSFLTDICFDSSHALQLYMLSRYEYKDDCNILSFQTYTLLKPTSEFEQQKLGRMFHIKIITHKKKAAAQRISEVC